MRRNETPEFVGLEYLKKKHAAQIAEFESWAASADWMLFHHSHYDWWTFPYGCHTSSYGAAYAIYEHEVELLKQDKEFIRLYLRGVELLMLSWGWNLNGRCHIQNSDPDQCCQAL